MYHQTLLGYCDPEKCCTGVVPPSDIGELLQRNYQNLRAWRGNGMIADYSGRASKTINGNPGSGVYSDFYIVTRSPIRADSSDCHLGVSLIFWHDGTWSGTRNVRWYKDFAGAQTWQITPAIASIAGVSAQTQLPQHRLELLCEYAPTASNEGFRVSKLSIEYGYMASVTAYTLPEPELTDAQGYYAVPANFSTYESLRGGPNSGVGTSVGRLAWGLEQGDSVVQATSRCMFQTCYPLGCYYGTASYGSFREDNNGNDLEYKVYPRNIGGSAGDVYGDVAIMVDAMASGDKIRLSSITAAATWEYTAPGAISTPTLITSGDGDTAAGLAIDAAGDTVKIEGNGTDTHVQTFSLWEAERI
jgi:hypothetical protein